MKHKSLILTSSIVLIILGSFFIYDRYIKRTPETIIKKIYNVDLKDFDYSISKFEEQWCLNGDGYCEIELLINNISPANLQYLTKRPLKLLPLTEEMPTLLIPKNYLKLLSSQNGYYSLIIDPHDDRDFYLLIIDLDNQKILSYYSFM